MRTVAHRQRSTGVVCVLRIDQRRARAVCDPGEIELVLRREAQHRPGDIRLRADLERPGRSGELNASRVRRAQSERRAEIDGDRLAAVRERPENIELVAGRLEGA